jgi:hypothetical protein
MNSSAIIQRVYISGFTGTGVYIIAPGGVFNANQWQIHNVYVNMCGGHGIDTDGQEAQGGLCTGAKITVVVAAAFMKVPSVVTHMWVVM